MILLRRELGSFFRSPIAYAVGGLFLAVQGVLFWALVELLSDPSRPAPFGAVLSSFFGGQVLYWLMTFVVVAAATMRLVAEERRSGTWETLMTAPVSDAVVVVHKWLAAYAFATLLWLPTIAFPVVIALFSPTQASMDVGVVVSSYLGVFVQLGAFTAVGVAASAATRSQVVAAATVVIALVALLLLGQLPSLIDLEPGPLSAVLGQFDFRGQLADAARGELRTGAIAADVAIVSIALTVAYAFVANDRLRLDARAERWLSAALVAVIAVSWATLAVRHDRSVDLSVAGDNRLSQASEVALARVSEPVDIVVVRPSFERFDPIYAEVRLVAKRMRRSQKLISIVTIDSAASPQTVAETAKRFGLDAPQLSEGGMVVVRAGERRAVVELLDFAEFGADDLGVGAVSGFYAEQALVAAVADVTSDDAPVICFTDGSGEAIVSDTTRYSELERRLALDGLTARRIGTVGEAVPAECRVLAVIAPSRSLGGGDFDLALARWVAAGGGLFVAAGVDTVTFRVPLAEVGLAIANERVRDGAAEVGNQGLWVTTRGHSTSHPISRRFHDRRTTAWFTPHGINIADPQRSSVLVSSSTSEPVAVASTTEDGLGRVVLWGGGVGPELDVAAANLELLAASLSWLAGRKQHAGAGEARRPQAGRLLMTRGDRLVVFVLCVIVLPLGYFGLGGFLWWRRRRG